MNGNNLHKMLDSNIMLNNPANPYLVSPYEPLQSTVDTNTLRIVYTDVITSYTPNTEISVGAPVTIENVTINGSSIGSTSQISNGGSILRADLASVSYSLLGDRQVVFSPGNANFASATSGYNVTVNGQFNIYNTVTTAQKGLQGYVPIGVNSVQYSMPIFADALFSIVPTPTTDTVTNTGTINQNTDITYLSGITNTLPAGVTLGQKKLLVNLNPNVLTFSDLSGNALVTSGVYAISIVPGTGLTYIGGDFTNLGNYIVLWNSSTATYSSLSTGLPNICNAIHATSPTRVYAGVNNVSPSNGGILLWDGTTWSIVGGGVYLPGGNSAVYAVHYDQTANKLYVGGENLQNANISAPIVISNIAVYDFGTSSWSNMNGGVTTTGGAVRAFLQIGTDLYVTGTFATAGGLTVNNIARWNTVAGTWHALGTLPNVGVIGGGATGYALETDGTYLYVGGDFTSAGGNPLTNFARYTLATGTWEPAFANLNGICRALTFSDNTIIAGGDFSSPVQGLAQWNGTTLIGYGTGLGTGETCFALDTDYLSNVYIGGNFTSVNGQAIVDICSASTISQTVISAVPSGLLRNAVTYTTLTFKRQYSTITLCYNGTEWVIVVDDIFVIKT
jgi:hypothetical protein